jgi:hypothetical protein
MSQWKSVLGALRWNGLSFVTRVDAPVAQHGLQDPEKNRGIAGWSSVWTVEVEMWLSTNLMIAQNLAA